MAAKGRSKPKRKRTIGKAIGFKNVLQNIRKALRTSKPPTVGDAILAAMKIASKIKQKIKPVRVVQVPKTGGILPLIPIFAGLSALGALSGGAAGVAKAVNDAKKAKQELEEAQRHNKTMEAIALRGKGLYLKPYKSGFGLFIKKKNFL